MNFILFDKWIKSCNFVRMLTFSTYKSSPPPFPPPPLKLKKKKKKILRAYMSSGWLCEFIVNSHVTGEQYWLSSLLTQRGRTVVLDRRPYREGALGKWSMTLLRGGMLNFITFTEMWFIYSAKLPDDIEHCQDTELLVFIAQCGLV